LLLIPALLLAFCGCSTVPLPSRFPLHGWTRFMGTDGGPEIEPGKTGDFLAATSPADQFNDDGGEAGLHLKPGDVIYLRRWSPGVASPREETILNRTSPIASTDRVPLRKVREGSRLYDYEREFLINVLTTNRTKDFKEATALPAELLRNEAKLWNALVESLIVKRILGNSNDASLVLTARMPKLLSAIPQANPPLLIGDRDREISGIEELNSSPYDSMDHATQNNSAFYDQETETRFALFNFLTVELNGVDVKAPAWEESQWTLQDWEDSEICYASTEAGDRSPVAIQWVLLATFREAVHVVPEGSPKATHKIELSLSPDLRSRQLRRISKRRQGYYAIPESDLSRLTIRDVREISWRAPGKQRLTYPETCRFH
jgi:hypothetical protein